MGVGCFRDTAVTHCIYVAHEKKRLPQSSDLYRFLYFHRIYLRNYKWYTNAMLIYSLTFLALMLKRPYFLGKIYPKVGIIGSGILLLLTPWQPDESELRAAHSLLVDNYSFFVTHFAEKRKEIDEFLQVYTVSPEFEANSPPAILSEPEEDAESDEVEEDFYKEYANEGEELIKDEELYEEDDLMRDLREIERWQEMQTEETDTEE